MADPTVMDSDFGLLTHLSRPFRGRDLEMIESSPRKIYKRSNSKVIHFVDRDGEIIVKRSWCCTPLSTIYHLLSKSPRDPILVLVASSPNISFLFDLKIIETVRPITQKRMVSKKVCSLAQPLASVENGDRWCYGWNSSPSDTVWIY